MDVMRERPLFQPEDLAEVSEPVSLAWRGVDHPVTELRTKMLFHLSFNRSGDRAWANPDKRKNVVLTCPQRRAGQVNLVLGQRE